MSLKYSKQTKNTYILMGVSRRSKTVFFLLHNDLKNDDGNSKYSFY